MKDMNRRSALALGLVARQTLTSQLSEIAASIAGNRANASAEPRTGVLIDCLNGEVGLRTVAQPPHLCCSTSISGSERFGVLQTPDSQDQP